VSEMTHIILFNALVNCTNQKGVAFYNHSSAQLSSKFRLHTVLPSKLLVFSVEWITDPLPGERILWLYDGGGSYHDIDDIPLQQQELNMINCADINAGNKCKCRRAKQ